MSNEALIAEVAKLSSTLNDFGDYRTGTADYLEGLVDRLADALEAAERDKRAVQAEALEAFAKTIDLDAIADEWSMNGTSSEHHWAAGNAAATVMLQAHKRAAEIRDGRA